MSLESDIRAFLIADADVTAIVGTRIFPLRIPQGQALPAIRYVVIASSSDHHLGGTSGSAETTIQFDCYSETYSEAIDLGNKVRTALVASNNGQHVAGSTNIYETRLTAQSDETPFREPDASDKWIYNRSLDLAFQYAEPAIA